MPVARERFSGTIPTQINDAGKVLSGSHKAPSRAMVITAVIRPKGDGVERRVI